MTKRRSTSRTPLQYRPEEVQCTRRRNALALQYAAEDAAKSGVPLIVFDERFLNSEQVDAARDTDEQPCAALFALCASLQNNGFCKCVRLLSEHPKQKEK